MNVRKIRRGVKEEVSDKETGTEEVRRVTREMRRKKGKGDKCMADRMREPEGEGEREMRTEKKRKRKRRRRVEGEKGELHHRAGNVMRSPCRKHVSTWHVKARCVTVCLHFYFSGSRATT